jgi:AcrR family transcriptional regulator
MEVPATLATPGATASSRLRARCFSSSATVKRAWTRSHGTPPYRKRHFAGKDALFAALVVTECRHLSDEIGRRALDEPDIRDALLRVAHDFNNLLCTGYGLTMYRIVVAEVPRFPELGRIFYDSGPTIMIDRIATILRRATERGLLKVRDPRIAAIQFISLVRGELHLTRVLGLKKASKNPADYIEASVDLFLAGYGAGKMRK